MEFENYLNLKLTGWVYGWSDSTGDDIISICINKKSKKKLIEFLNWGITDLTELRKKVFDNIFKKHVYIYDIENDDIIEKNYI